VSPRDLSPETEPRGSAYEPNRLPACWRSYRRELGAYPALVDHGDLAERISAAYSATDLAAFGDLLADDVRWGDDDHPNRCHNRDDVLRTFSSWITSGVTAKVLGVETGPDGVLCRLHVEWTDPRDRARGANFIHVFMVRDERVSEIRRYDDVKSAAEAVGAR
jgi:ketosteroid isomerase-like protein